MNIFKQLFKNISDSHIKDKEKDFYEKIVFVSKPILLDYGKSVFLYKCNGSKLSDIDPQLFKNLFGLKNISSEHKKLVDTGYLIKGTSKNKFNYLTVKTLKGVLRDNELKVSGNKADLIDRLLENNISPPDIDIFVLSEKGNDLLKFKEPWIKFYKFNSQCINYIEYWDMWNSLEEKWNSPVSGNDILWKILSKKIREKYLNLATDGILYLNNIRDIKSEMFAILKDEKKIEDSVRIATEICAIDLSGLYTFPTQYANTHPPIYFAPYFINYIYKYRDYYNKENLNIVKGFIKYSRMDIDKMDYYIKLYFDNPDKAVTDIDETYNINR